MSIEHRISGPANRTDADMAPPLAQCSLMPRFALAALGAAAVVLVVRLTGALDYLSFESLADHRVWLVQEVRELGLAAPLVFIGIYALSTALSLPTGLLLSTAGGFLFGTAWGGAFNVIGATIGAIGIFLVARSVLGDALRARAGPSLQKFEAGFHENELSYMLILRLVPAFPFWLVNIAPAFLGVRTSTYVIGTLFGTIPGALVFASIGTGLGAIMESGQTPSAAILFEPKVIIPIVALAALSLLPVLAKRLRPAQSSGEGTADGRGI